MNIFPLSTRRQGLCSLYTKRICSIYRYFLFRLPFFVFVFFLLRWFEDFSNFVPNTIFDIAKKNQSIQYLQNYSNNKYFSIHRNMRRLSTQTKIQTLRPIYRNNSQINVCCRRFDYVWKKNQRSERAWIALDFANVTFLLLLISDRNGGVMFARSAECRCSSFDCTIYSANRKISGKSAHNNDSDSVAVPEYSVVTAIPAIWH